MSRNKPTPAAAPVAHGSIHSALEYLDTEISKLQAAVDAMEARLYPVLDESKPVNEPPQEGYSTPSPCARLIVEKIWRVQELAHRIEALLEQLDI